MPLHRQERMYGRMGYPVSRSTISQWHDVLSALVAPLIGAMFDDARGQPILFTDATVVKLRAKIRCRTSYYFTLIAPERHVLFAFTPKHNNAAIDQLIGNFRGHLVSDGHTIYDHLHNEELVVEVGCWAHARRYFVRSAGSEPECAAKGILTINKLFEKERLWRRKPPDERRALRQISSMAVADGLFAWAQEQVAQVHEGSPIYKALRYLLNQKKAQPEEGADGVSRRWAPAPGQQPQRA